MKIRKAILLWIMQTRAYSWALKRVIPYVRFTTYYTSLRGSSYQAGYKRLRAGDIILTTDKRKLTTLLIGGEWAHAAYCTSNRGAFGFPEVAEMTHNDFTYSQFFDLCKESDRVMIIRCRDFDEEYIDRMNQRVHQLRYSTYDQRFKFGIKELYCSELVYEADFERRLVVNLEDLAGLGQEYISPTGLRNAKNCDVIFDSDHFKDTPIF